MTNRITRGVHELAWPGRRVTTGDRIPGPGAWEIVDHEGCGGNGHLHSFGRNDQARPCPNCRNDVTWQLSHLAAIVAADHRGVGKLP